LSDLGPRLYLRSCLNAALGEEGGSGAVIAKASSTKGSFDSGFCLRRDIRVTSIGVTFELIDVNLLCALSEREDLVTGERKSNGAAEPKM